MVKKFPPLKNQSNFKDIFNLIGDTLNNLKILEAKTPYAHFLSSALEIARRKLDIIKNRLSAEYFIDVIYIQEQIKLIREQDPQAEKFIVEVSKAKSSEEYTFSPYVINVRAAI
ncbi:hypothetical protein [Nonlabens ulvanivorans]|uniref:hypothetical protein n=1 Tax=Nonlabens ulvanivorans TaxID=906888 RepID=UPI0032639A15